MFLKIGMKVRLTGSVSGRLRSRIVPRPASSRVTAAMNGGACKPEALLGEAMGRSRQQ